MNSLAYVFMGGTEGTIIDVLLFVLLLVIIVWLIRKFI